MEAEAYKEWINLYTEEVEEVWNCQKDELRKATMIMFVLQREFKRVQNDLEKLHMQFRIEYDTIKRDKLLNTSAKTATSQEENPIHDQIAVLKSPIPKIIQRDIFTGCQLEPETLNESSDETVCISPNISWKKFFKRKKPKFSLLDDDFPKNPFLSLLEGNAYDEKKGTSVFDCNNQIGPCTLKLASHVDDLIDCIVIDDTPNASKRQKEGRTVIGCTQKKNKMKKSVQENSIHDQTMVLKSPTPKSIQRDTFTECQIEPETLNESSDETICVSPKISRQKLFKRKKPKFSLLDDRFSKKPSLSLQERNACDEKKGAIFECNNHSGPCTLKLPSHVDDLIDCTVIDGTPNASKREKKGRRLTGCTRKKNKMKKSGNGATLTQMFFTTCGSSTKENENSSMTSNDSKITSAVLLENDRNIVDDTLHENTGCRPPKEIICKEPVVRGKNRQKLKGWDCEECREFYEGLDLNTQEINSVLNKCSKHRATRKSDDYTPPGYWTLAFTPTQKTATPDAAEESPTDYSTFFQF